MKYLQSKNNKAKLLYIRMWVKTGVFALLVYLFAASIGLAEGCDSSTNANCIETNSNTNSNVNSTMSSETTVKSPPPSAMSPTINTVSYTHLTLPTKA